MVLLLFCRDEHIFAARNHHHTHPPAIQTILQIDGIARITVQ